MIPHRCNICAMMSLCSFKKQKTWHWQNNYHDNQSLTGKYAPFRGLSNHAQVASPILVDGCYVNADQVLAQFCMLLYNKGRLET
jgi:hypothetical protein